MADYAHRGHTVTELLYRFVWVTKCRHLVLRGEIGLRAREVIRPVCEAREMTIIKGVVSGDHVHLYMSAPPHRAPAQMMPWIKGRTSRRPQEEFAELRRRYWGQHLWVRGLSGATSGAVTDGMIQEYIERHEGRRPDPDFRVEVPD